MPTIIVTLLAIAVAAQFLIIMHLMHSGHTLHPASDCFQKIDTTSRDAIANNTSAVTTLPTVASTVVVAPRINKPGGVAATLLLHAPKWFQRRYSQMVMNALLNIPEDWVVQIFYSPSGQSQAGIDMNKGLVRLVAATNSRVILTPIAPEVLKQRKKRFELMYHEWIWENMLADRVLMFGGNSILCSNTNQNISAYDEYDWVGAPWNFKKGIGGDGSISLRNRTVMLEVIDYELSKHSDALERSLAYKKWGQDDIFFVSRILEMQALKPPKLSHVKLAPRDMTLKFGAIGSAWNEDVVVVAGTLPGLSDEERNKFIAACPDIKMVYPALHNPACFGAVPEADKCAASICALKPRDQRRGGC